MKALFRSALLLLALAAPAHAQIGLLGAGHVLANCSAVPGQATDCSLSAVIDNGIPAAADNTVLARQGGVWVGTAAPQLGSSGVPGSITFGNATSGTLKIQPAAGALGVVTVSVPGVVNDTLVTLTATQELTAKTLTSAVAKGTWTASGTWTIPGFTLTGNITGNGTQIITGGTTASSSLTLASTGGAGTSDFIDFLTGSGVRRARFATTGSLVFGVSQSAAFTNVLLDVNYNTSGPASPQGGLSHVRITAPDGGFAAFTGETFGTGSSFFTMRAASGTIVSPTALVSGHIMGSIAFYGYTGATYNQPVSLTATVINTMSGSDAGGYLDISTTPAGSTVGSVAARFQGSSGVAIASTLDPGANNLYVAGSAALGTGAPPAHILDIRGGVTGAAPIHIAAGTNQTSAVAGSIEYDGVAPYFTPVTSNRGVLSTNHICAIITDFTLTNGTGAQKALNCSTNGAVTLPSTTSYYFEAQYIITNTGVTSHSWFTLFGGTATLTSIAYSIEARTDTASTPSAANVFAGYANVATTIAATAASTSATENVVITLRGFVRINAGGTFIPSVQLNNATGTAATMKANSYFRLWPAGINTVATVGNWS